VKIRFQAQGSRITTAAVPKHKPQSATSFILHKSVQSLRRPAHAAQVRRFEPGFIKERNAFSAGVYSHLKNLAARMVTLNDFMLRTHKY
jgi:hypothetical protein